MFLAFLDELGHIGPYVCRSDPSFNQSPVFGLAGYIIPHHNARNFASWFYQLKARVLYRDIAQLTTHPATWEKKGSSLITTKNIRKYPGLRDPLARILNELYRSDAKFFYYAREKYQQPEECHAQGLYTTVLGHAIRQADQYVSRRKSHFLMILDQHSDRAKLLETAAKTMFGANPARALIEPPFHVESHLYQTIQAADWIATIVGRAFAYRARSDEFSDWK